MNKEFFNLKTRIKQQFSPCYSYTGEDKSNMALIDVNMISGFEPIIGELEMKSQVSTVAYTQFEFIDGVLSFYFDEVRRKIFY